MSTPIRVHVASRARFASPGPGSLALMALLGFGACADRPPVDYAGLDRPLDFEHPQPVSVGVVADVTGAGRDAGRTFVEELRRSFQRDSGAAPGTDLRVPDMRVNVLDDRGTAVGVRAAASRLEANPAAHVAIVEPGLGRAAAAGELAPRTVVVCAGGDPSEAVREGVFVVTVRENAPSAAATWIQDAMVGRRTWPPRELAERLRVSEPPAGHARIEGSAPAQGPDFFHERGNAAAQR